MFATDAILAMIMCCTRSNYSWDVVVQRVGNKLFFDKRDESEFGEFSLFAMRYMIVCYITTLYRAVPLRNGGEGLSTTLASLRFFNGTALNYLLVSLIHSSYR